MITKKNGTDMKFFRTFILFLSLIFGANAMAFSCSAPQEFDITDMVIQNQATIGLFEITGNFIRPLDNAGKSIFNSSQTYQLNHYYCPANMQIEATPLDGEYVLIALIDGNVEGNKITLRMSGCCGRDAYGFYSNLSEAKEAYNRILNP